MKTGNKNDICVEILRNRGITSKKHIDIFLHPPHPDEFPLTDVSLNEVNMKKAVVRIKTAIKKKESIVVYTDYDADGLTAGAIVWEVIHKLGGMIMPYVPHRVDEGYGLTKKGIDAVLERFNPTLLITVDHGITAAKEVEYAKSKGIDVIVTDHHLKPKKLPDSLIIHTTKLSGAGVAYFFTNALLKSYKQLSATNFETLSLAAIGAIADMMPLLGPNRSIVKYGLMELKRTKRVGLLSLMEEAGIDKNQLTAYSISHMLAPRLNAIGRMEHALDGLRLLCTNNQEKAKSLASKLGLTNRERQQLTIDTTLHARDLVQKKYGDTISKKLLFVSHKTFNQGIIGLVAGKLMETYYLPSIVISKGEEISKASARSIKGFDIVEAIRSFSDLLIDVGGHPLAAGFTIKTEKLLELQDNLEKLAEKEITKDMLKRPVAIDLIIPLEKVTDELYDQIQQMQPFGFGNPEPVFLSKGVSLIDFRRIGAEGKHLKLRVGWGTEHNTQNMIEAVFFNQGNLADRLIKDQSVDIAYTIDRNEWNGNKTLQLKLKNLSIPV